MSDQILCNNCYGSSVTIVPDDSLACLRDLRVNHGRGFFLNKTKQNYSCAPYRAGVGNQQLMGLRGLSCD